MKRVLRILLIAAVLLAVSAAVLRLVLPRLPGQEDRRPPVICLDPGHGGDDAGAVLDARYEKNDNLRMALRVRELLAEADPDLPVLLTREEDVTTALADRPVIAGRGHATVFVSIHRNSGGGTGVETWLSGAADTEDKLLAQELHDRIVGVGQPNDRGVRSGTASNATGSYYVLSHTPEMASCLLELGFIDSTDDDLWFDGHFDELAQAIADGILACITDPQ